MAARSLTRSLARLASPRGAGRIFAPSQSLAPLQSTNGQTQTMASTAGARNETRPRFFFFPAPIHVRPRLPARARSRRSGEARARDPRARVHAVRRRPLGRARQGGDQARARRPRDPGRRGLGRDALQHARQEQGRLDRAARVARLPARGHAHPRRVQVWRGRRARVRGGLGAQRVPPRAHRAADGQDRVHVHGRGADARDVLAAADGARGHALVGRRPRAVRHLGRGPHPRQLPRQADRAAALRDELPSSASCARRPRRT